MKRVLSVLISVFLMMSITASAGLSDRVKEIQDAQSGLVQPSQAETTAPDPQVTSIKSTIERRIRDVFWDTTIDSIDVFDENDGRKRVAVHLTWSTNNSVESTKKHLNNLSDDLAAYTAQNNDNIGTIYVFWLVPSLYKKSTDVAAKYTYNCKGNDAYKGEKGGLLYR